MKVTKSTGLMGPLDLELRQETPGPLELPFIFQTFPSSKCKLEFLYMEIISVFDLRESPYVSGSSIWTEPV